MNRLINLSAEELGWKKELMVEISYFDRVNEKIEYVWNPEKPIGWSTTKRSRAVMRI